MTSKPNRHYQTVRREKMRAAGFQLIHKWVHHDDKTKAIEYIDTLNSKRNYGVKS